MRANGAWVIVSLLLACSSRGQPSGGARGGSTGASSEDGGSVVLDADQACREAVRIWCEREATCRFGDPSNSKGCIEVMAIACPESFFNQASTRTVAGITACLDQLRHLSCTEVYYQLLPSCWSRGTRAGDTPCAYESNCASGRCSSRGRECGFCDQGPAAPGEVCVAVSCRAEDFCHHRTKRCTPGATLVLAPEGAPCDIDAQPSVGCMGDLHCSTPSGKTAGTCRPLALLDLGQPCFQTGAICRPPLFCNDVSSTAQCEMLQTGDALCASVMCDQATYCAPGDGGAQCVPRATAGEVCRDAAGVLIRECEYETICVAATGVCTRLGARGDACSAPAQPCQYGLACTNGRCTPLDTSDCPLVTAPLSGDRAFKPAVPVREAVR